MGRSPIATPKPLAAESPEQCSVRYNWLTALASGMGRGFLPDIRTRPRIRRSALRTALSLGLYTIANYAPGRRTLDIRREGCLSLDSQTSNGEPRLECFAWEAY